MPRNFLRLAQGSVDAGGTDFEPTVFSAFDLQHELQLARDLFTVFRIDELLRVCNIGQVNRDTQQTASRALDLY